MAKCLYRRLKKAPRKDAERPSTPCFAYQQGVALPSKVESYTSRSSSYYSSHASVGNDLAPVMEAGLTMYQPPINSNDGSSPPPHGSSLGQSPAMTTLPNVGPFCNHEGVCPLGLHEQTDDMTSHSVYQSTSQSPIAALGDPFAHHRAVQPSSSHAEHGYQAPSTCRLSPYDQRCCTPSQDTCISHGSPWATHNRLNAASPTTSQDEAMLDPYPPQDQFCTANHDPLAPYHQDSFSSSNTLDPTSSPPQLPPTTPTPSSQPPYPPISLVPSSSLSSLWAAQDRTGWGPPSAAIHDLLVRRAQHADEEARRWQPIRRLSSLSREITGGLKRTLSLKRGGGGDDERPEKRVKRECVGVGVGVGAEGRESLGRTKSWKRPVALMGGRESVSGVCGRRRFLISDESVDEDGDGVGRKSMHD
ncbi:hypothetical protein CC86DRAFT_384149 [Ophiobolus disseminans]|uniref:Uncharacterized protein n=1 Tax=Ophiobolus disseminans TaxID=1469910 RepID=A0A6A6ZVY8_9PLEO|nr:hypothetical protein CC86DRAFT_384149 [Ophiobolus disseminans]